MRQPARVVLKIALVVVLGLAVFPWNLGASNHREAPITALDHKADITDLFAFRSVEQSKITIILCVDPLLEPANGPTLFPFDPGILYEIKIDNDHDALEDIVFKFQFTTEFQLPNVYTAAAGFGPNGANAPGTSNLVVPPKITTFDNPGLNLRQTYTVTMVANGVVTPVTSGVGAPFYAVPCNIGPRTMDYESLYNAATYTASNGMKVFAGTVDDPFFIDLGATFDTANFRLLGSGIKGVLTPGEDSANQNFASDTVSGFAVNAIAIEVPIENLTSTGVIELASSPAATIGIWGTTSRRQMSIRKSEIPGSSSWRQVQRIGNPLINELLIGIGSKDRFSMEQPVNDAQFAPFFLDPPIVRIVEALYGGALVVPPAPRNDLLPLVQYLPPIAASGTPTGPIADLLRINTGVSATPIASASRLGLIGGDPAGFPNGRRLFDDVVDITLRVGVGGVLIPSFNAFPNNRLGDGVNKNDVLFRPQFPYLGICPSGRNRRHIDPGEPGAGLSGIDRGMSPGALSPGPNLGRRTMSGTSRIAVAVVVALLAQARIEGQDSRAGGSAAMRIRSGGAESRGVVAQPRAMPAAQRIRWAEGAAAKDPKNASAWNALAMAHARRARETGNPDHYARAMDALDKSFAAAPENYEGLRTKAWVLLGQHEFAKAREVALKLNKSAPDDVLVYGLLTDANIELGNYDEAEKAAQWMLDMRPGNVPGLTRGAYLRELFGDVPGAIEFMSMAFDQTSEQEIEDRAWMMTHIAHLHLETGKLETAATAIARALELVPDYHYALAQLGKLRVAQGKHDEAADVFRKHYEIAPHPENRYEWACALLLAGRKDEASTNFAAFEKQALAESEGVDNANRELIAYWLEHAGKPVEALALATNEIKRRHDVLTLDAYAWALFHNKRFAEARKQIDAAMKVGVRDARILYHAAAICAKLADHDAARTLLAHALATNPHATVAPSARSLLAELERDPKSTSAR